MATLYTQNFNSYNDGDLNGQGGWYQGYGTNVFTIQSVVAVEGKAVSVTTTGENVLSFPVQSAVSDATQTFYFRASQTNILCDMGFETAQYPSGSIVITISFQNDGKIYTNVNTTPTQIGTYEANTWYSVQVEWRSSDDKHRISINGGTFSDWYACSYNRDPASITCGFFDPRSSGTFYWDYFAENPLVAPSGTPSWRDVLQIIAGKNNIISDKGGII